MITGFLSVNDAIINSPIRARKCCRSLLESNDSERFTHLKGTYPV